ncbi:hypothetical protein [Anaeromicropila populeti]|uniref:Uncharacterized protein n=1 Tax=Anaeromicropila populeti TaxID=37658 RepID=A0A1I6HXZ7_9FIRM|nr:hypothetical protein [Anaeromicropila populeti]SFR59279.1 hypothetical protein SAMN05661086_00387 [Anaeromicropila populeti]
MNNFVFNSNPETLKVLLYSTNNGEPISLISDNDGILYVKNLNTNDETQNIPLTAFREVRVATLTPAAGWTFNYNINPNLITSTTTGSGTVTQSNSRAILQTTAAASSSASIQTINALTYTPGMGGLVRFTAVFTTGAAGSTQIIGIGDSSDGFFFGYNGSSFGVLKRRQGTDEWISQNDWNKDKMNGTGLSGVTLDTTKGNVYSIRYQWLGYGIIEFYIENPSTGDAILVHRIQYANANTEPSIYNPTLPVYAKAENTTNNTNITLQTPSAMAFVEGQPNTINSIRNSISASKTGVTTETALLTIQNKTTYAAKTNRVRVKLDFVSVSVDGSKNAQFRLVKNATLSGASYTDISTSTSVVAYDTTGTYTASSGKSYLAFQCAKTESLQFMLDSLNLILAPGETLTILASSSATTEPSVSVSWRELF